MMSGVNAAEREVGMAICILCSLSGNNCGSSELLWPAVFKGLQSVPPSTIGTTAIATTVKSGLFCKANRSMILLEYGCKEGILSGMGNGDLVMDAKERMLPPPPNVELLLGNAVQFILSQLMAMSTSLFATSSNVKAGRSGGTRSSTSNSASSYIAILIGQLCVLHFAYPSSVTLSVAVDAMLKDCVNSLKAGSGDQNSNEASHDVKHLTLAYAALSCGASFAAAHGAGGPNNL